MAVSRQSFGLLRFSTYLVLGDRFSDSIDAVVLPASLQHLAVGSPFYQPIQRVAWPASLEKMRFGNDFDY